MSAPKLRFKGFNDDWEEALLTDIVHFYNGKGHEGVVDENGEYILINSKFISSDRAVFKRVSECHQKVFDDSLVMVMSDVPNGKALAKFIHIVDGKEYALNQRIGMLVFKEEFSSKFYQYPLNRNKYYLAFDSGVGQTNLRKDEVLECPIYKLSLREQTKIASFLSAVDEKISQLTQKHELLSQYKQGMMQKLFSQQIRFKADDGSEFGEWEERKLGEVCRFVNGRAYKQTEWEKEGTPVIRLQNLTGSGKEYYYSNLNLPDHQYCYNNDLLYMWSATFGPVFWQGEKAIFHYHIWKIEVNPQLLDKKYMYFLLDEMTEKMKRSLNGSTMLHVTKQGMENTEKIIPSLPEQTKIANFLSAIDQKVEVVAQQIEQAKQWKKGLLQQMFV